MDDDLIKRETWDGCVPVCFSIADEEVVGFNRSSLPEPCYLMVPRISYFPMLYEKLEKLFGKAADFQPGTDELWLSFEEQPLQWHYPVGVLYDLYGRNCRLPWTLTVHFKNFPDKVLLHCHKESVESHFRSKIKEADTLKHRSEIINSLTPQEFNQLYDGLKHSNFSDFWAVNLKLMRTIRGEKSPFRFIPFCVYKEGSPVYQRLITSVSSETEGKAQTLFDLLHLYDSHRTLPPDHTAMIHGTEVPGVTPLQWLSEHLSYPDNFLHICIVPKDPPGTS